MRLTILVIALISTAMAQQEHSAQQPQAQVKYHDPNGLKVDWKFFSPQNQYRSHLQPQVPQQPPQQSEMNQGQPQSQLVQVEPDTLEHRQYHRQEVHPEAEQPNQIQYKTFVQPAPIQEQQYKQYEAPQVQEQLDPNQIQYSRYPSAPSHVKQIVPDNFKPQIGYSDPNAFSYQSNAPQQYEQQPANAGVPQFESQESYEPEQQKSRRDYGNEGFQGRIVYKSEYEEQQRQLQQQQQPQVGQIPVTFQKIPLPPIPKIFINKNTPMEIQQLLQYQARLPYEVIANSITYMPKSTFIPKQLPIQSNGPYHYRSKSYYANNDRYESDFEGTKPVEENHRH